MGPESSGEDVELRTTSTKDRGDCGSNRASETYCHAVQLNPIDHPLPDVVSQNNDGDDRNEDPYDTIGSVGTLPRTKGSALPDGTSYCGEENRGYTTSPCTESESEMASGQSLASYAVWSQLSPTNQSPPGVSRGWCSKKRAMIFGIVALILLLVSALTVTATLLITGQSGQTGGNPPPPSTRTTPTTVSAAPPTSSPTTSKTIVSLPSSTPTISTSGSTSVALDNTSTSTTPSSISATTTLSTSTISVTPSASTASISPSTTTVVLASSTTPTTTANTPSSSTSLTTPSPSTPSTSLSTAASTTTASTTTRCSSSRKCHSCTSRNVRCPVNGTMAGTDPGQVMPCPCGTACFSAVRYSDGNVVHRGCTEQYPAWDIASSTDLSCREIRGDDFLCFCLGDRCNAHDMTPYINYPLNI